MKLAVAERKRKGKAKEGEDEAGASGQNKDEEGEEEDVDGEVGEDQELMEEEQEEEDNPFLSDMRMWRSGSASSGRDTVIRAIDKAAIHRICSGQVVLDVAGAVKELVENSLDAGATSVEVRLKDLGAELIEVADNGCGVAPPNWQALTLKYHTSKIAHFSDLQSLSSFGFRGEALSSLCALADVTITTRTANEPIATRLVFDHGGKLLPGPREQVARAVGTTVSVAKIFSPLPVRRREFERNVRREFAKLVSVLQAYCVVSAGARILCTNQSGRSSARTTVVQTAGTGSMRENIIAVFGAKAAAGLDPVDITFPLSPAAAAAAPPAPATPSPTATSAAATASAPLPASCCRVTGFLSRPGAGSGRSAGDRQFFFLNGRPVDLPRLSKLLNELYRSFNSLQFPAAFLNVSLSADAYDVNVTPDKRKVFLHSEAALLSGLRAALSEFYSPDRYVYRAAPAGSVGKEIEERARREAGEKGGVRRGVGRGVEGGEDEREGGEEGEEREEGRRKRVRVSGDSGDGAAAGARGGGEIGDADDDGRGGGGDELNGDMDGDGLMEEAAEGGEEEEGEGDRREPLHQFERRKEGDKAMLGVAVGEAAHEGAVGGLARETGEVVGGRGEARKVAAVGSGGAGGTAGGAAGAAGAAGGGAGMLQWSESKAAAMRRLLLMSPQGKGKAKGKALGLGIGVGGVGGVRVGVSEGRGGSVECVGGTADRISLSRGAVGGREQARAWQGYETRHKAAAERERDWQRAQREEEEEEEAEAEAEEEEEDEEEVSKKEDAEEEEEERECEGANVGRRDGSSRALRGEGQRSLRGVASQAQGKGMGGVGRERSRGEISGGVERARGGADGRQAGLDAWLGKGTGGGSGRKGGRVDGGHVRERAGGKVWAEKGGKDLKRLVVEREEDEKGDDEREEDEREEDEDSEEVREVEQVSGEGGGMQVERSGRHDEERNDATQCGVDGALQEATRDEWAGKNVLDLPLMTQEMTQADLPELMGSQLLPGTQLAGQQERFAEAVAEGAGKGRCCGGHTGELEEGEGQERSQGGERIEGIMAEEGAALGTNRVAWSGGGWEVKGGEGSVQVQFDMRRVQQVWRRRAEMREREAREERAGREGRKGVGGSSRGERQSSFAAASVADGAGNAAHSSGGRKIQQGEGEGKEAALEAAARELERRFDKRDFASMAVIGQFNLGFIIGRLGSDLFIVDQVQRVS
ncbi:unnamed protein product [Closterium sp. Naga37s-1]|nr:unnamed protein product [Closterium sp. Naga37s-1]